MNKCFNIEANIVSPERSQTYSIKSRRHHDVSITDQSALMNAREFFKKTVLVWCLANHVFWISGPHNRYPPQLDDSECATCEQCRNWSILWPKCWPNPNLKNNLCDGIAIKWLSRITCYLYSIDAIRKMTRLGVSRQRFSPVKITTECAGWINQSYPVVIADYSIFIKNWCCKLCVQHCLNL